MKIAKARLRNLRLENKIKTKPAVPLERNEDQLEEKWSGRGVKIHTQCLENTQFKHTSQQLILAT